MMFCDWLLKMALKTIMANYKRIFFVDILYVANMILLERFCVVVDANVIVVANDC